MPSQQRFKISVPLAELRDAVQTGYKVAGAGHSILGSGSVNAGLHLHGVADDQIEITSCGDDIAYQERVAATGCSDVDLILPKTTLAAVLGVIDGDEVTITYSTPSTAPVTIRGSGAVYKVAPLPYDEAEAFEGRFAVPPGESVSLVHVDAKRFAEAARRVVPAAGTDQARPVLCALCLHLPEDGSEPRLVATDSYRLAVSQISGLEGMRDDTETRQTLLPAKGAELAARLAEKYTDVTLDLSETRAWFSYDDRKARLSLSLVAGKYPTYEPLFDQDFGHEATFVAADLLTLIKRAEVVQSPITLAFASDSESVEVTAVSTDGQQEYQDTLSVASYTGSGIKVSFGLQHLKDGLDVCGSKQVCLQMTSETKPAMITPAGDDQFEYLVMPIAAK